MEEVRYAYLRPKEMIARRAACPVAYAPLGTLEWHGLHLPPGTDTIQAEGLAELCARKGGGLAFPSLWYGESRNESLMESGAADKEKIAELLGLPPENFLPDRMPFSSTDQVLNYQKLLLHILAEVESLGFKLGVLVAGHYPLIDHARAAALLFNKRRYSRYQGMLAWACVDFLFLRKKYPEAGDHAAGWETSHMLSLAPETVDLSLLPPKGSPLVGVHQKMAPQDANPEFGRKTLEEAADAVVGEVKKRLANIEFYKNHGMSLTEGE